jgi:uncharacterized protein
MSHRMYLYNVNTTENRKSHESNEGHPLNSLMPVVAGNDIDTVMMMEWKYEFPLFLHPLFAGGPYLAPPVYNGTTGGIFADAAAGKMALEAFYSFIGRHAETLTGDAELFRAQKEKLFNFLANKAIYNSFHLDAWDVFNMSDDPHEEQATELLSLIKATNDCIKAAIDTDNPALLNECPGVRDNSYGITSFRQLFSHSAYGYGWEVIQSGYFEEEQDEEEDEIIFTENGLEGLKKKDGTIIIPARYDEVFSFPDNEIFAVVKRDGKYGYVNREGQLIKGLLYDDAYDVLNGFGRVQIGSQHYLLQPGAELPSTSYDDLMVISEEAQWYVVARDGSKSVINAAGQTLLPFVPIEIDRVGTYNGSPLMRITDEIKKGKKTLQFHGLLTADGQTILEVGYLDICSAYDDVVIVKAKDYFGMYSAQNRWVLEMEYDGIFRFLNKVFIVEKDQKQGLYIDGVGLVPPIYEMIVSGVNWHGDQWETFATNEKGAFRINHQGNATPLTTQELEGLLANNNRYRYNEKELRHLVNAAGDALPPDMLCTKGFEALSSQDYEQAIKYYEQAAAKGSANAMNDLGYIYEAIEGFVDSKRSFEWYTRGVEAGSPDAANGLANCYMDGFGTTADIDKAIELYEQGAAKNVSYAHYNLGVLYYEANHVEKNDEKALTHFVYASTLGYKCHNYVGVLLEQKEDYKNAYKAYKDGAKYKDADCAFNLARLHELGHGCKQDPGKALSFYNDAIKWGAVDVHLELRRLYLTNEQVRDEKKALEHEQLAREAGVEIPERM